MTPTSTANRKRSQSVRHRFARICSLRVISAPAPAKPALPLFVSLRRAYGSCLHGEADVHRVALVGFEELALVEPERPGDEHRRERLLDAVEPVDGLVVVAPRGRELVLDVGELLLKLQEVLRRPQLRVRLRYGEQPVQAAGE